MRAKFIGALKMKMKTYVIIKNKKKKSQCKKESAKEKLVGKNNSHISHLAKLVTFYCLIFLLIYYNILQSQFGMQ